MPPEPTLPASGALPPKSTPGRASAFVVLLLAPAIAVGCSSDAGVYEEALRYPARADRLVLSPPSYAPAGPATPGQLAASIEAFAGKPGAATLDPGELPAEASAAVTAALDGLFGTPAAPSLGDTPADAVPGVALDAATLAAGGRAFAGRCAHCHGLPGDGRGPSGPWLFPHPRDFRQGVFKTATGGGVKPTAERLLRLLREGVPGSAMPMFDVVDGAELRALVAYVLHLSVRGEVEFQLLRGLLDEAGDLDAAGVPAAAKARLAAVVGQWAMAKPAEVVEPAPGDVDPMSVRRGHALFRGNQVACWSCHTDYGKGEPWRYDAWGSAIRIADLTRGEFRWGGTPADLAAKVRHGIPGANMPAHPALSEAEVRDLVNFLRVVSLPPRLPDDVRAAVYPAPK